MKRGKIFKRIFAGVGIAAMLLGVMPVGQAQAYDFTFTPPFLDCGKVSDDMQTISGTGKGAYVYPSVSATKTTYCIITKRKPLDIASDYVKTGDIEKLKFTYKSGYVGKGNQTYRLYGFPTNTKFSLYNVYGIWNA